METKITFNIDNKIIDSFGGKDKFKDYVVTFIRYAYAVNSKLIKDSILKDLSEANKEWEEIAQIINKVEAEYEYTRNNQ